MYHGTEFTIDIVRDINIIMWVQKTAMAALIRLAIYCFINFQGIHFDLVVDIIIVYLIPSSIFLTKDCGSSKVALSNGRFDCLENAITEATYSVDGETKLSSSNIGIHSALNSNMNR